MARQRNDSFWVGFSDLMISMFFVMLVLFAAANAEVKTSREKNRVIEQLQQSLRPLQEANDFYKYEQEYKRFALNFDVEFKNDSSQIDVNSLKNSSVIDSIEWAGKKLETVIRSLELKSKTDTTQRLKNVSYILLISGYASKDHRNDVAHNNYLSYRRAEAVLSFWRKKNIDFEKEFNTADHKNFIDLHIAGNGFGGVGRFKDEIKNQRFVIQIVPKVDPVREDL